MRRVALFLRVLPSLLLARLRNSKPRFDAILFDLFLQLGGVYTKFLQIIILNTKILNTIPFHKRQQVFSKSPPSNIDLPELLSQELPLNYRDHLTDIQQQPFATGSFANVYYGKLKKSDGSWQPIIIKALRPGIKPSLKLDIPSIRFFVWLWSSFNAIPYDLNSIASEYSKAIRREVNYRSEVKNAVDLHNDYTDNPHIVIPRTYPEFSSRLVIVQDYLDGILFEDIQDDSQDPNRARDKAYSATGSDLFIQLSNMHYDINMRMFTGKKIHGDIHPGNVMLLADNKIAYIDFGLLAEPIRDRQGFFNYIKELSTIHGGNLRPGKFGLSIFRINSGELYNAFSILDRITPKFELLKKIEQLLEQTFYESPSAEKFGKLMQQDVTQTTNHFNNALNGGGGSNRLALRMRPDGLMARRSASSFVKLMESIRAGGLIMPDTNSRSLSDAGSSYTIANKATFSSNVDDALEVITEWLEDLATSDQILFRQVRKLISEAGFSSKKTAT